MLGNKNVSDAYVGTKHNVADDPTRKAELRKPEVCPPWLRDLRCPEPTPLYNPFATLRLPPMGREAFAGCAGLTKSFHRTGVHMWEPLEAYPQKGAYVRAGDVTDLGVFQDLCNLIIVGLIRYMHFGIDCKSWGNAARLTGCTRTREQPRRSRTVVAERDYRERAGEGRCRALCVAA